MDAELDPIVELHAGRPARVERWGSRREGGSVGPPLELDLDGVLWWPWRVWFGDASSAAGWCRDKTNAVCAVFHALDPDEAAGGFESSAQLMADRVLGVWGMGREPRL